MLRRDTRARTAAARAIEAGSWIIACVLVLSVVAWHARWAGGFWERLFREGNLFLGQSGHRPLGESAPDVTEWLPAWLAVVRHEADLSVGLLAASAGIALVHAARPRDGRRAWRGPGAVACVSAVAVMLLCVAEEASLALKQRRGPWGNAISNPFPNAWPLYELRISLVVLGAWTVMAATGRWRPRGTWADRAGIVIGSLWLAVLLYRIISPLLIPTTNYRY